MHPSFTFKARIRKKNIHLDTMEKYGVFRETKRKGGKRIWKKIFHDEETSNYCGLQKKINIWGEKSVIQRNGYQLLL